MNIAKHKYSTDIAKHNQLAAATKHDTQNKVVNSSEVQCTLVECIAVLRSALRYSTVQHCAAQCNTEQCSAVQCSEGPKRYSGAHVRTTILMALMAYAPCTALHCSITVHCTPVLQCTVLQYYTVLQ